MVISNLKLYTTAEALAAIIAAELEKSNLHGDEHDAITAFANAGSTLRTLAASESPLNDMIELLEEHGFEFAVYHPNGKRYWYRTDEMVTAIDKVGDENA